MAEQTENSSKSDLAAAMQTDQADEDGRSDKVDNTVMTGEGARMFGGLGDISSNADCKERLQSLLDYADRTNHPALADEKLRAVIREFIEYEDDSDNASFAMPHFALMSLLQRSKEFIQKKQAKRLESLRTPLGEPLPDIDEDEVMPPWEPDESIELAGDQKSFDAVVEQAFRTVDAMESATKFSTQWDGLFEWTENLRTADGETEITRSHVKGYQMDIPASEPNVNTRGWPCRLSVIFLPQDSLKPIAMILENSRVLRLKSQDDSSMRQLHILMAQDLACAVQFPPTLGSTSVMFILYDKQRKRTVGLLPNKQKDILILIREIFVKEREKQQKDGIAPRAIKPKPDRRKANKVDMTGSSGVLRKKLVITDLDSSVTIVLLQIAFATVGDIEKVEIKHFATDTDPIFVGEVIFVNDEEHTFKAVRKFTGAKLFGKKMMISMKDFMDYSKEKNPGDAKGNDNSSGGKIEYTQKNMPGKKKDNISSIGQDKMMASRNSDQPPDLCSSSESEDENVKENMPKYMPKDAERMAQFEYLVRIRTLSPLIFPQQDTKYEPSNKWQQMLLNEDLLKKEWLESNECSSQEMYSAVELMLAAVNHVVRILSNTSQRNINHRLLQNAEKLTSSKTELEKQLPKELKQFDRKLGCSTFNEDSINAALLYTCHQYDTLCVELQTEDVITQFEKTRKKADESAFELKVKGNDSFKDKDYVRALGFYFAGLMRSPFSYILYANRAQALLKKGDDTWLAVMDARRSIVLNKHFAKGYLRCAVAWQQMRNYDEALKILEEANELGLDPETILSYTKKIKRQKGVENFPLSGIAPKPAGHVYPAAVLTKQDKNIPVSKTTSKPRKTSTHETETPTKAKPKEKSVEELLAEYKNHNKVGSKYLVDRELREAINEYTAALDLIKTLSTRSSDIPVIEQIAIKYSLAAAYLESGSKHDIHEAVKLLEDVQDKESSRPFPLVHLGLGKAYLLQTRFSESRAMLQTGLKKTNQLKKVCYPQTDVEIPESYNQAAYKKALRLALKECDNPPRPDAVCRADFPGTHTRAAIYISEPDFKGYVRVKCFSLCIIDYHPDCYKKLAASRFKKASDKELLHTSCFTPDCDSVICLILMFDNEGVEKRRVEAEKPPVVATKQKTTKEAKKPAATKAAAQRNDRKQKKKSRKQEDPSPPKDKEAEPNEGAAISDQSQQPQSYGNAQAPVVPSEEEIAKFATILKKEEDAEAQQAGAARGVKVKKRKEKPKKAMTLGEFVGNQDDGGLYDWEGEETDDLEIAYTPSCASMGIDDFEVPSYTSRNYPVLDHSQPFVVPEYMRDKIAVFESSRAPAAVPVREPQTPSQSGSANRLDQLDELDPITPPQAPKMQLDDSVITDFLHSYFAGVLEYGPINTNDPILAQHLQSFPTPAHAVIANHGDLPTFLAKNTEKFTVIGKYLCLVRDKSKALKLVESARPRSPSNQEKDKQSEVPPSTIFDTPTLDDDQISECSYTGSETSGYSESSSSKSDSRFKPGGANSRPLQRPKGGSRSSVNQDSPKIAERPEFPSSVNASGLNTKSLSERIDRDVSSSSVDSTNALVFDLQQVKLDGSGDGLSEGEKQVTPASRIKDNNDKELGTTKSRMDRGSSSSSSVSLDKADVFEQGDKLSPGVIGQKPQRPQSLSDIIKAGALQHSLQKSASESASLNVSPSQAPIGSSAQTHGGQQPEVTPYGPQGVTVLGQNFVVSPKKVPTSPKKVTSPRSAVDVMAEPRLQPRIVATSRATNTDPILMDWGEVEALMTQLEADKKQLETQLKAEMVGKVDAEKAERRKLVQEQSEQLEQLVTQMMNQEELLNKLKKEREVTDAKNAELTNVNSQLQEKVKELEASSKSSQDADLKNKQLEKELTELRRLLEENRRDRAKEIEEYGKEAKVMAEKYGMDLLRAERAEISLLKFKQQKSMENFEKSVSSAEKEQKTYMEYITSIEKEGGRAPPELIGVYHKWCQIVTDLNTKQKLCKATFDEQILKVKRGERLDDLPRLEIVDPPSLPQRPAEPDRARRGSGSGPPGKEKPSLLGPGPGHTAGATRAYSGNSMRNQSGFLAQPSRATAQRQGPKKNSFEKIMQALSSMFPDYRGTDIKQYILRLRESRGGTLTGMNLQQIVARVADLIMEHNMRNPGFKAPGSQATQSRGVWPPQIPMPAQAAVTEEEIFEEEEDPCVICHEELSPQSQMQVECGHRFHDQCIRRWMREQSTCPTCRKHFLLTEDFPALA